MDRFFSLFQTAASCSKWNKIRLGPRPGGYRSSWPLGKEMGHEIPTSQMQYHADYKETDQKDQCFL